MTAMMAFFYVYVALQRRPTRKIQKIATRFNPMKLNAKKPTTKGIEEVRHWPKSAAGETPSNARGRQRFRGRRGQEGQYRRQEKGGDGEDVEGRADRAEEELFNDPYGVLARPALKASAGEQAGRRRQRRWSDAWRRHVLKSHRALLAAEVRTREIRGATRSSRNFRRREAGGA